MQHVGQHGLDDSNDPEIWDYAAKNNLHILTKDSDFNDILNIKGFPPKIVWVRSGNVSTSYISNLMESKEK